MNGTPWLNRSAIGSRPSPLSARIARATRLAARFRSRYVSAWLPAWTASRSVRAHAKLKPIRNRLLDLFCPNRTKRPVRCAHLSRIDRCQAGVRAKGSDTSLIASSFLAPTAKGSVRRSPTSARRYSRRNSSTSRAKASGISSTSATVPPTIGASRLPECAARRSPPWGTRTGHPSRMSPASGSGPARPSPPCGTGCRRRAPRRASLLPGGRRRRSASVNLAAPSDRSAAAPARVRPGVCRLASARRGRRGVRRSGRRSRSGASTKGLDESTSRSTRSGYDAASSIAITAPVWWPTTAVDRIPRPSSSAIAPRP